MAITKAQHQNIMTLKEKLISAATQYDRKQATRRGYNPHALGIYFGRIDAVCQEIEQGKPVRAALLDGFNDRFLSAMLKAAGEADFTAQESSNAPLVYRG